jgi:glycosyltransferase involved in cell wall biosynthesis
MSQAPRRRVSIGLPVYNGAAFLDGCIRSILSQDFTDFELNICDNASTDDTPRIAERWCRADPRITLHRASANRGAAANFNWCFELAQADLFKWCACDDLLEPGFFSACVAALDANADAVLAYSGAVDIDAANQVIGEIYDNQLPLRFGAPQVAVRFRDLVTWDHSCIAVFGLIRTQALRASALIAPYVGSDRVLLAQLALSGPLIRVPGNLILHRQHAGRSVTQHKNLQARAAWFDPSRRGKVFPHIRLAREYIRLALDRRLSMGDRLRCLSHVARWIRWAGGRQMLEDLRHSFG